MNIARISSRVLLVAVVVGGLGERAAAADPETILLKAGETVDLGPLFWVINCRSELTKTPIAEVLEGPPELTVAVKDQKVLPRKFNCAQPVSGGELSLIAAKDIKARSQGKLFIRLKYPTRDGERQGGREINYTLFPAAEPASNAADPTPKTEDKK